MRVDIDKSRNHQLAIGVDHLIGVTGAFPDSSDHSVPDADVSNKWRRARSVDYGPVADNKVKVRHTCAFH